MSAVPDRHTAAPMQPGTRGAPGGTTPAPTTAAPAASQAGAVHRVGRTRASATWTGVAVAVVLAIALLVFILQNGTSVPVHFVGADGHFPLALGLLAAAVAGALIVLIPGLIRMAQLRRTARRHRGADLRSV